MFDIECIKYLFTDLQAQKRYNLIILNKSE